MKTKNSFIGGLVAVAIIFSGIFYSTQNATAPNSNNENIISDDELKTLSNSTDNLIIHYIDVGQADSILITTNTNSMLIDAGNNDDGKTVTNYLKKHDIKTLDYIIGTHPHEDHIGGLDNVINSFNVKTVLMPNVSTTTKTFEDVLDALIDKDLAITTPTIGEEFALGDAKFTILSIDDNDTALNESSIVIKLTFGKTSYLFCGDAEKVNEDKMLKSNLDLSADIIKLGHHGSSTSSSLNFLKAVNPRACVISVGTDNSYGHPHKETLNLLNKQNISIYRTDLNGTIVVTSDGTSSKIFVDKPTI